MRRYPARLLIYEPYFVKLYGNTRYILSILSFIDRTRYEPVLVVPNDNEALTEAKAEKVRCIVLSPPRRLRTLGGGIWSQGATAKFLTGITLLRHTATLCSLIREEGISLVQCHNIRSLLTVGPAARISGSVCVWYVKGVLDNPSLDRIGFWLANCVLIQSPIMKARPYSGFMRAQRDKTRILPNGIDLASVRAVKQRDLSTLVKVFGIRKDSVNFAYVGALYPKKGLDCLIEAFAEIWRKSKRIHLFLIGDHGASEYRAYAEELVSKVKDLGLSECVTFTGYRTDALDILSLMDVCVLPSFAEGMPRSIMEAMALGKPVIATNVGGVPELVRPNKNGFLVEPGDAKGLAKAIYATAQDANMRNRFGQAGEELIFAEYSIEKNIQGLMEVYEELMRGKESRKFVGY